MESRGGHLSALLAPAVDHWPRAEPAALAGLRVLAGLMWLYNVSWKRPPAFSSVESYAADAVENPVLPPFSWLVEQVVLPAFPAAGWGVLLAETALAVLLLTGTFVRVAALLGVAQSFAIGLSVANTPGEWPWAYWLMVGVHVALVLGTAGRYASVDAVRAARLREGTGRGTEVARRLLLGWGAVVAAAAVLALLLGIGQDPLAAAGPQLGGSFLSISLGSYNLLGALVLLVVGALMVAAAVLRRRVLALAAAALAVLAALSLYVQLGFGDPLLGGSNTSAALLLSAAVVSAAAAPRRQAAAPVASPPSAVAAS